MESQQDTQNKTQKKLRILCFHGYYNNSEVMKYQLKYYQDIFSDFVEFEYINGFYEVPDIYDLAVYKTFKDKLFYSWAYIDPRTNTLKGFKHSFNYVVDYMNENGPYDGVLGFSQGSFFVRTLLKLDEFNSDLPRLKHTPKFGIILSGPVKLSVIPDIFETCPQDAYKTMSSYSQPLLYMYGEADHMLEKIKYGIIEEGEYYVIKHKSGHNVPKLYGSKLDQFIDFIDLVYYKIYKQNIRGSMNITNDVKVVQKEPKKPKRIRFGKEVGLFEDYTDMKIMIARM